MSGIRKLDDRGAGTGVLIALIVVSLLFVATASFAYWAFSGRQDYKNNSNQKAAAAVAVAKQQQQTADAAQYAEQAKQPLTTYNGPSAYGSLVLKYPKTWSAYVQENNSGGSDPVNGYFEPNFVPNISSDNSYALRVQIVAEAYADAIGPMQGYVKSGKATATPYTPAKVAGVTGLRFDGQLFNGKTGSLVVMPIRDKTLEIWTESSSFVNDFNNNVLPNFSFQR